MCHVEKSSAGAFIRTGFWTAPRRQLQSRDEKQLSFYLLTCPERNSIGLFPLHLGEAAGRTGLSAEELLSTLQRLVEQREIDVVGYWVLGRNWWDHNHQPGPGHREKIERALADAPPSLRAEFELIAEAAGVFPFGWQEESEAKGGASAGGTRGSTEGSPGGNNNDNENSNSNPKNTTTTRSAGRAGKSVSARRAANHGSSAYASTAFPAAAAEAYRSEFVRVCVALSLTPDEAHQLALELCARVESADQKPQHRVEHPEPWLTSVVLKARAAGAPILRQGIKYQQEAEKAAQRKSDEAAEAIALQLQQEERDRAHAELVDSLQALDDHELAELAMEVVALYPSSAASGPRERTRTSILERRVPSGLGGACLVQALQRRSKC